MPDSMTHSLLCRLQSWLYIMLNCLFGTLCDQQLRVSCADIDDVVPFMDCPKHPMMPYYAED